MKYMAEVRGRIIVSAEGPDAVNPFSVVSNIDIKFIIDDRNYLGYDPAMIVVHNFEKHQYGEALQLAVTEAIRRFIKANA